MLTKLERSIENFEVNKSYRNDASRYLPIGPGSLQEQDLNWNLVYKNVYEKLLGLKCELKDLSQLFEKIIEDISSNRETKELRDLVKNVYLNQSTLSKISPYLKLICEDKEQARTKTMESVFSSMLSGFKPLDIDFTGTNCIEGIINSAVKSQCITFSKPSAEVAYLPFLDKLIKTDLRTLSSNAHWLADEFNHFIELYSFLYLIQLSLHLRLSNHRFEQPKSQEVYFILETEKASKERHECNTKGYDPVLSNKNSAALDIFPNLGYLELISDLPIWMFSETQEINTKIQEINKLNELICTNFDIPFNGYANSLEKSINNGLHYHKQLFNKSSKTSARYGANQKVFNVFKEGFSLNFKSNRKAAGGWYFQLSTKTILLVTNLIIGSRKKILIDDVLYGFKQRGMFFDLKSRNALLKIYENIGNIEKLSDSGDAVYVKSTI